MLARCSRGASYDLRRPQYGFPLRFHETRQNSSLPERTRKLPNRGERFTLKPWQRNFLIGGALGIVISQGWLYYDGRRRTGAFVPYSLAVKEPVSSTASIFHLAPKEKSPNLEIYKEAWEKGVWNVHFKQPQLQILRAYTPLPPLENATGPEKEHLRFLIRHDPHGEVSSYLHRLPIGAEIELQGPNLEYEITPDVRQVVFFAGGTGIAPALQVAHALFEGEPSAADAALRSKRTLHILWANRKREDCLGGVNDAPPDEPVPPKPTWSGLFTTPRPKPIPPVLEEKGAIVRELEDLKRKHPGQITVEYFVNAEDTWIGEDAVFKALSRFDDKDFTTGYATPQEQRQILVSGPPGFISYLAGPKEWRNGREEQGPVSKIIAHAISRNPHNVKVWKI